MSLESVRADLVAALEPLGHATYDHVPDNVDATLPVLAMEPAENYISFDQETTYRRDEIIVRHDLWVLVPDKGENEAASAELDQVLAGVLAALPADFVIESTSKPMSADAGEWSLHGLRITLATLTTL